MTFTDPRSMIGLLSTELCSALLNHWLIAAQLCSTIGRLTNTRCCKLLLFLYWAANTLLQASAFMRSPLPFKSDCCFFLPFAFSVTSFCFRCDKRQLSLFVLHFSSRGRYTGFFCQLHGRCTLLDFKFKFQEFNNKTNSQVHVFLMLVTGQKLLASEQIKYSAFSRTFLVLGNRTRISSVQTNKMK